MDGKLVNSVLKVEGIDEHLLISMEEDLWVRIVALGPAPS